jgi:hypothetical protein
VPWDSAELSASLRHVVDPAACQRAGATYDKVVGAADVHFLVYSVGSIFIVSQRHGAARELVLNQACKVLWRYNGAELAN